MLEGSNITVIIEGNTLLSDVSVQVHPGEVMAVLGPNGAGKSTLLRVLSGDLSPESGTVAMGGRSLDAWKKMDSARVRAVLMQQSTLSFAFRVIEVALMGRSPHTEGPETRRDYEIAREALFEAGVDHLEKRLYTTLSGGESQRVHLARVLAQIWDSNDDTPRYLLLDEPTSSLDLAHQHHILSVARAFAARDVGVLVVLHDLNLAAQYADTALLLDRGREIAAGIPAEVLQDHIVEEVYGIPITVIPHPHKPCPLIVPEVV